MIPDAINLTWFDLQYVLYSWIFYANCAFFHSDFYFYENSEKSKDNTLYTLHYY